MGHIKDISNQPKLQSFPGATFEIEDEPPEAQCSEAVIEGDDASTDNAVVNTLLDPNAFTGFNLVGKICTITASVGGNPGDYDITFNTDHQLQFIQDPGVGDPVTYYIHNGGALIETRDVPSFAEYIHAAGYAYTVKGGKLFTNMPSSQLQNACKILFDPLT